jgi:hypothetical protein
MQHKRTNGRLCSQSGADVHLSFFSFPLPLHFVNPSECFPFSVFSEVFGNDIRSICRPFVFKNIGTFLGKSFSTSNIFLTFAPQMFRVSDSIFDMLKRK